ncbi:MAG: FimV/HubP family polar landmark protein [Woeseia sp.]
MSRRIHRLGLLLVCLIASKAWALGLGDIRLDSALNEPLRAEIALLSATPEELENLRISLASNETFERYGIDRPLFLSNLQFVVQGGVVRVTSPEPITEPFVTFLVEAVWSRGRLLREYTVLLDPPTFAPPPSAPTAEAVTAPRQTTETDRGRIERTPAPAPRATPPARQSSSPAPATSTSDAVFDTRTGDDYLVRRGDTLWRIAEEVRPDARLTMNQTMLAIYEANPQAFAGNINVLRANARLRVPSADEIFRISRGSALSEIRRQNQSWRGETPSAPQPTLTLVPPDAEQQPYQGPAQADADSTAGTAPTAANDSRIRALESRVAEQESLLEIRDSELARLRSELQRLREERAAAAGDLEITPDLEDDTAGREVVDGIFVDEEPAAVVDEAPPATDAPAVQPSTAAPQVVAAPQPQDKGIVGTILGFLTSVWGLLGLALLVAAGVLMWFARRASGTAGDAEDTGTWESLQAEEEAEAAAATQRLSALRQAEDASIVVVEQTGGDTIASDSVNIPGLDLAAARGAAPDAAAPVSLEDTFSSETAINLDQSDPIAEADFHMAYGLYDQAADLINGALAIEPERTDLIAKLCEIYFVWGNRDSFVSSAKSLKTALGDDRAGAWDKIVIMGQQLAPEEALFAHVTPGAGARQSVDLDFEEAGDGAAGLDMDFAGGEADSDSLDASSVIDLGAESPTDAGTDYNDDMLDFSFDADADPEASATREMPTDADGENTVESPTIEQAAVSNLDSTAELPLASNDLEARLAELDEGRSGDETAEIDLDDLGLDLNTLRGEVSEDMLASNENDPDFADEFEKTSESPRLDSARTGRFPATPDDDLLDATGQTQVLTEDFGSVFTADNEDDLGDDDATMMSPGLGSGQNPDFDFAATEALPRDTFDDGSLDATAETPAFTATEMDLDLDDLTAALKLSESGDTVEQKRDEETVERPAIGGDGDMDFDFDIGSGDVTQEIPPGGVSEELREARTMTEVGTKLDLARAYVDMGDPGGARNILEEVLEEGDEGQRQQAQKLLDSLPS